jgi:hypothetical protein
MKTLTVWQTCIQGDWRYATPEIAAIACYAGNPVRLVDVPAQAFLKIHHVPRWGNRDVSKARIRAAEKAISKQVNNAGLFAAAEKELQPTPEERIKRADEEAMRQQQARRQVYAQQWREARARLADLPADDRAMVIYKFNCFGGPHDASALNYLIKTHVMQPKLQREIGQHETSKGQDRRAVQTRQGATSLRGIRKQLASR